MVSRDPRADVTNALRRGFEQTLEAGLLVAEDLDFDYDEVLGCVHVDCYDENGERNAAFLFDLNTLTLTEKEPLI